MNLSTFEVFKSLKSDNYGIKVEGDTLKKCQKVILSIAEDVISICEKENIWYELGGGTALGAIRHQGFIPWDDDIDINILGRDFELLKKKVYEYYGNKYTFLDYSVSDYGLAMGKVMLNNTIFRDRESYGSDNCGFFIDLFLVENVPDNPFIRKIHGTLCMISGGLLSCRKFYKNRKFLLDLTKENPEVRKTVNTKIRIGRLVSFLSISKCAAITDGIYGWCKNDKSKYVSIPSGRKHYFGGMYKRDLLLPTEEATFEGHKWKVVKNYSEYFTNLYGPKYMELPSEEKREHHVLLELKFPEKTEE